MKQCRQRQNELWTMIEQRGQMDILHATANALSSAPTSSIDPVQQSTVSDLVIDIKRLQSLSTPNLQRDKIQAVSTPQCQKHELKMLMDKRNCPNSRK